MSLSDIAAWYAAAVATAVFVWDIVKWFRTGPRLRVNARCNVCYPDARVISTKPLEGGGEVSTLADYCHVEVLNVGGQPTTLIDIEATNIPRANGMKVACSALAFTVHSGSRALPTLLAPGEMWSARVEMGSLESIAEHGSPILQIRASHRKRAIETPLEVKRRIALKDGAAQ